MLLVCRVIGEGTCFVAKRFAVKQLRAVVICHAFKACEPRMRRNVGLLVLKVVEAEGLKKMDTFGKSDPFVEAYTQAHQTERTVCSLHALDFKGFRV